MEIIEKNPYFGSQFQPMKKFWNILLVTSILVFALSSIYMIREPLWSWIPLFNYLSIFFIFIRIFKNRLASDSQKTRWLKLTLLSGAIFAIGFPPSPIFPGMMIGFIPMMVLENEISQTFHRQKPGLLFGYLFFGFWFWNILSTFWVANTAYVAGMLANSVNAALMTLPWLAFHMLTFNKNYRGKYILLAGLWIMFEFLHTNWDISWPWLTLGNGMATCYPLIQWYEYIGYFGGSAWIWAINILVGLAWMDRAKKGTYLTTAGLVLTIPVLTSLVLYFGYEEKGLPVDVVVVQPNFEPHYQKFNIPEEVQVDKIFNLTAAAIDSNVDLIVMPETVLDPVNMDDYYGQNPGLARFHDLLKLAPKSKILLGVGGYHIFSEDPGRSTIRHSDGLTYEMYNAAIMLESDSVVEEYHKSRFVPAAEIFPFKKVLPFLKPLVKKLGGTYEGFAAQPYPTNFKYRDSLEVAPVICYESIYGGWVRQYVERGAGLLAIITNDGWWDNTPGHLQHLAIGRLRAIENRKDIARAANTGTSCFINQRGDIRMATQYETDAVIRDKVNYSQEKTFYSRHGDYIILLTAILSVIMLIFNYLPKKSSAE